MGPIRKLVQLVLDRAAARRMERDAKRSVGVVDRSLQSLKRTALAVGGALVAAFGVRALIRFGKETVRVAGEAQAIWNRLAATVENTGVKFKDVEADIRSFARAMQDTTTVGDEQFATILNTLVALSGDYERSLRNVGLVADFAARQQLSLETSAQQIGRAMTGNTQTLTRYIGKIEEGADVIQVLRERMAGAAENEAKTLQGRLDQLNNEWDDFKQAVGEAIIAGTEGESLLERLILVVQSLTAWVDRNQGAFAALGSILTGIAKTVGFVFRIYQRLTGIIAGAGTVAVGSAILTWTGLERALAGVLEVGAKVLDLFGADKMGAGLEAFTDRVRESAEENERLARAMIKVGEAAIRGELPEPPPRARAARRDLPPPLPTLDTGDAEEKVDAVTKALQDFEHGMRSTRILSALLGDSFDALGAEIGLVETALTALANEGVPATDVRMMALAARLAELTDKQREFARESDIAEVLERQQEDMRIAATMAELLGSEYSGMATEAQILEAAMVSLIRNGLDPTDERLRIIAERMKQLTEEAELTEKQMKVAEEIAANVADVVAGALGGDIGIIAAAKAKQNAILAAEQSVIGLVASLNPVTAPRAAAHFAAAAKFAAISAAWAGLAGATGGFSAGGGASAGGAASARIGERESARAEVGNEINVYFVGEGFDAVNPRVQRVVQGAIDEITQRQGNAKVRVYRRASP